MADHLGPIVDDSRTLSVDFGPIAGDLGPVALNLEPISHGFGSLSRGGRGSPSEWSTSHGLLRVVHLERSTWCGPRVAMSGQDSLTVNHTEWTALHGYLAHKKQHPSLGPT